MLGSSRYGAAPGRLSRLLDAVFRIHGWFMAACLVVMVVLLFGNVTLRYLFNSGINISDEVSRLAFVWLIFIGAVLAMRQGAHMGVTMLVDRLRPRARRAAYVFCQVLIFIVMVMLTIGSWRQAGIALGTRLPVTGLPAAVFDAACLYAAVAIALIALADIVRVLAGAEPARESAADALD